MTKYWFVPGTDSGVIIMELDNARLTIEIKLLV